MNSFWEDLDSSLETNVSKWKSNSPNSLVVQLKELTQLILQSEFRYFLKIS